jgi:hypothetical protein
MAVSADERGGVFMYGRYVLRMLLSAWSFLDRHARSFSFKKYLRYHGLFRLLCIVRVAPCGYLQNLLALRSSKTMSRGLRGVDVKVQAENIRLTRRVGEIVIMAGLS